MKYRDQQHRDQPTLWDTSVQPAIDQADKNANRDWKQTATDCLLEVAKSKAEFTSDDVVEMLEQQDAETHNLSALGGVFQRAEKAGVISNTGDMVQTRIARRHRKLTLWKSKLYRGA